MTPASILATALTIYCSRSGGFLDLVRMSGVPSRKIRHAMNGSRGHSTDADVHLRLCTLVGIDPVTGDNLSQYTAVGPLDRKLFAIGVRIVRYLRNQTMRQAAREIGISTTTLCFIENGQVRSIESMLACCKYMGVHPTHYVSCETTPKTKALQRAA